MMRNQVFRPIIDRAYKKNDTMHDDGLKDGPWFTKGTYMNQMLHCGGRYNGWVQHAIECLPPAVLDQYKDSLVFISTGESDGCRVARALCESREIIILSERILPRKGMNEADPAVRYSIFAVFHEVAHAYLKHRSPMFDGITPEKNAAQETEADALALRWYNDYVTEKGNPDLPQLTINEIEGAREKNQAEMEAHYECSN